MRLLRNNDYLRQIQSDNLAQIIEDNEQIRLDVEQSAQAEMISYLSQRYRVNKIFTDTTVFDITATYSGKNLIEYTETEFSDATVYTIDDRVVYSSNIYKSIAGSAAHAFVPSEWTLIVADKTLYYAKTNEDVYDNDTTYTIGLLVWYDNIVYTAKGTTIGNLPTDTNYWTAGSSYSFSGFYPDNTTYWTKGDNRNQQIVMYLIDITLYHLHSRISPRNVPKERYTRYDGARENQTEGAIGWLKNVAKGFINADIEEILPEQGVSIRWGSNEKNENTY